MAWEAWRSSVYCEPVASVQGGSQFTNPYMIFARTEQDAATTAMVHFGVRLLQLGADVAWLKAR